MNPALDTKGHSASQPGLRGHSIGEVYPWRVVGYGDGSWAVEDCRGETFRRYWPRPGEDEDEQACNRAHEAARIAKLLHPLGRVEETPWGALANISGPLNEIPDRLKGYVLRVIYDHEGNHDHFHVSWHQDLPLDGLVAVTNTATGKRQKLSLAWLAHHDNIDVWIDLA